MRETKKPVEDLQDVRDETFLLQHSSRPSNTTSLDKVYQELSKLLDKARVGTKAADPTARAFSSGLGKRDRGRAETDRWGSKGGTGSGNQGCSAG